MEGEEEEQDEGTDAEADDDDATGAGVGARGSRTGGTGRRRGGAPTRGGAGAGAGRGGGAHARGDGDEQLSNGDEDDAEESGESGGEMLFGGIIYVKRLDYYTPSIQLMFCYGWLCPRLLEPGVSFAKAYNTPGYEGMMGSTNANNVTRNCWLNSGRADWVRPHLMTFIRDAHAAAAVPGGPPLPPAVVGKALIELVRGSVRITAVPFLGSDDIEDYSFYNTNTGKVVESTEELLDQLRAALATRASTASSTSQVDAASPPDEHTGVEGGTGLVGNHENNNTTADPRMNFKVIGEIGRTTIVKTRKTLTLGMIDEALSRTNVIKAEGSDPEYYAPVIQRLKSELVVAKAGGGKSVNLDAPALDAAWLHDGIKKMNRYYKDEKNQLQDYGGYLYDKFSAAVQAKDLVTMALCLRQVEVAEGKSGNNPFVCSPWYRQYEVDLSQDPSYTPSIHDAAPIEIDEGPRVYELQSDDDEDDGGGDDGTGTGGAGRATANVKAESDMEIEECGEVGEERAVGDKSKAPAMEMDRDGRDDNMVSKRQKKASGSAGDCNDGLRAVAGNSFAGASATMVLGGDASNGEAAAAAAASAVTGGSGGRKTTGEGDYVDMEEEKEEGGEDDGSLAIGTKIRKFFPECNSWHNGVIEAVPAPGDKSDYFHARYDDGDDEDLDESEAKEHAHCWKYWSGIQSNGDHDTATDPQRPLFSDARCSERLYTDTVKLLFCYGMTSDQVRAKETPHEVSKVDGFDGIVPPGATRNDKEALKKYWQRNKQRITAALEFIRGAHAAAALPGGNLLPQVAVGKALVELVNGDGHDGGENITASPFLGSNELSEYSFFKTNSGEPVGKTHELLGRLRATLAARAPAPRISVMGANGTSQMLRRPLWSRCGPHYTPDMKTLLCYMWLNDRTRGETYAAAARLPGYGGAWRADKENTINHYYCDRGRHGDNAHRVEIIAYLRGVHAAAAVPGGPPLPPAAVGKIPADLVQNGANIIAVPDLGSARAEDYSFFETNTGEPVEQTQALIALLRAALAPRASAVGLGGGGIFDGANSGATPPATMPSSSAPPAQDILGVLAISVLPPSAQHGTVRDALRNNPSAVAFAAASEEMAQQQAATAAALPSGEAMSGGSGAWSGMGSGGLIGRSEDDLLECWPIYRRRYWTGR